MLWKKNQTSNWIFFLGCEASICSIIYILEDLYQSLELSLPLSYLQQQNLLVYCLFPKVQKYFFSNCLLNSLEVNIYIINFCKMLLLLYSLQCLGKM